MRHVVAPEEAGHRLDVTVARHAAAPRSRVAEAIRLGNVLVNGEVARASRVLVEGDVLDYELADPEPLVAKPERIDLAIVYEDDDLLVVDKPAGMVTHPAHGTRSGTLVNALLGYLGTLPGDALRPGLVHRLDRDTSGLLVVAKTPEALSGLGIAMKARKISREYLGLVHGIPEFDRGTLDGPIGREPHNRLKYIVTREGRRAVTHYEVVERFARHTELRFRLETGRTHQIRVHCAAMHHPIYNDPIYGRSVPGSPVPGQALHAWRLAFTHPRTRVELGFESAPPPAYARVRAVLAAHER